MKKNKLMFLLLSAMVFLSACGNEETKLNTEDASVVTPVEQTESSVVTESTVPDSTKQYDLVDFEVPDTQQYAVLFYENDGVRTETYYTDSTVVVVSKIFATEEDAQEKYRVLNEKYTQYPAKSDYGVVKEVTIEQNMVTFIENRVLYDSFTKEGIVEYANETGGMLVDSSLEQ